MTEVTCRPVKDHPWDDIVEACLELVDEPHGPHGKTYIFQKFSCSKCKQRLTIEEANVLYTHGTCDKCGTITDIRRQGCNYMVVKTVSPDQLFKASGLQPPPMPGLTIKETETKH